MSESHFISRQEVLKSKLASDGLDGIFITHLTNVRYICGFTGSAGSCLVTPDGSYFLSDGRYTEQANQEVKGCTIHIGTHNHFQTAKNEGLIPDGLNLAFEKDRVTVGQYDIIQSLLPKTKWQGTSLVLEKLAAVKDKIEIDVLRTAVEITDKAYESIIPMLKPGTTEKQVASTLSSFYMKHGDGEAYSPIVAGGPNGALPHAQPSERPFEKGDFIVIDAAAKYAGYHADMTRTPVVGEATEKHHEVYQIVKESQQRGIDAAKASVSCKAVDTACRDYINSKGYGKYFIHGTGHGIGLEIHTWPRFSEISNDVVEENYVMTIEPGVYIPGWGGVRIEDDVIIRKDSCEVLNQTTKDLIILN
jgi:Xaa-Pro aminopeptidase